MTPLFDKNRHRLNEGEKEMLWRRIREGEHAPARRPWWGRLALSAGFVLAAALVVTQLRDPLPEQPVEPLFFQEEAPEAVKAEGTILDVVEDRDEILAAAPAQPEATPSVAPPRAGGRESAAFAGDESFRAEAAPAEKAAGRAAEPRLKSRAARGLQPAGYGEIEGHVRDGDSGETLPYANVLVEGTVFGAMSLEDGSYSILLPAGLYEMRCLYMGYEEMRVDSVLVEAGQVASVEFGLKPTYALKVETIVVEADAPMVDVKSSRVTKSLGSDSGIERNALQAGPSAPKQEIHVRGGRSGEVSFKIDGVPIQERGVIHRTRPLHRRRCWVPPRYRAPNGEPFADMYFENYGTNPFLVTEEDALSTFALDVDRASYTITRSYVDRGELPPRDAVRVEEFVNAFDPGYAAVEEGDFAIRLDGAPSPHGKGYHLLRVGLQAREVPDRERKPANLVFVVDTSGSMGREDRLGLVRRALRVLAEELRDSDTVGIVEYGSAARVVLEPTLVEDRRLIHEAIDRLRPGGSTNAEEGLDYGYTMASRVYSARALNRLILCSDGVANTGETGAEAILEKVRLACDRGIGLTAVGFGMGNYNDVLMEKLANQGDGNYYYVDEFAEARRVFAEELTGTLQTVDRDAKLQVEFDPRTVLRYRLIGYENRAVADEDFRDDDVDAGEVGAGHTVTALYEIKLSDKAAADLRRMKRALVQPAFLGTVRLRYEKPEHEDDAGEIVEMERDIELWQFAADFDEADPRLRLAATVAEFAEILRESYWAEDGDLQELQDEAMDLLDERRDDDVREFLKLLRDAARIERGEDRRR